MPTRGRLDPAATELQVLLDGCTDEAMLRRVLDVGCGRTLPVTLSPTVHLIGLDVDERALAENGHLDEAITADIQSEPLPSGTADAVICWNVLEHVREPVGAIQNMAGALRSDGLLAISIPNVLSLKGLLTKLTPHRFHRSAYRRLLGSPLTPYQTHMGFVLRPSVLERIAPDCGLRLISRKVYASGVEDLLPLPLRLAWKVVSMTLRIATLGRYDPDQTDAVLIFRKA